MGTVSRPVTSSTVESMIRHRSIRRYTDESVQEEVVEAILRSAQAAPTSSHKQAFSVVRVVDPVTRRSLAAVADDQEWVEKCPVFLVWCADLHRIAVAIERLGAPMVHENVEEFLVATIDTTLAAATAFAAAESLGLGGVFIGGLRNDPDAVTELLGLPPLVYPVFGMCLGYPADDPWLKPRLPLELVYHRDRYDDSEYVAALDDYDAVTHTYYVEREGENRVTTWSREMARKFAVSQRPHMRAYLESQGFVFD
jgi:FMN reductase (NADPH)